MGRPRQILPDRCYMLTRRCAQGMFLLRPDRAANQIYLYCLAVAANRCGVQVVLMVAMSNHHHVVLHDPHGRVSEFTEHLHKLMARAMNALRGRWGHFWDAGPPSLVHLATADDVLAKLVYVATNPVAAGLVARADEWPGVTGWSALCTGEDIVVRRPEVFFRDAGPMPDKARLRLTLPTALGNDMRFRAALTAAVAARESELARDRAAAGSTVLGTVVVCAQRWSDTPAVAMPHRRVNPRLAARDRWVRVILLAAERAFQEAYRLARDAWRAGERVVFPAGTYGLRRFAGVAVATTDPIPIFVIDGPSPVPIG